MPLKMHVLYVVDVISSLEVYVYNVKYTVTYTNLVTEWVSKYKHNITIVRE